MSTRATLQTSDATPAAGGGVKVVLLSERLSIEDRLRVSSGVVPASNLLCYANNAFIAAEPWRTLSADWRLRLRLDQAPRGVPTEILIIDVPAPVVSVLQELAQREDEGNGATRQELVPPLNALLTALRRDMTFTGPLNWLGFRSTHDDAPTITWDAARKKRPGLHVDSWDGLTISQRANATNRLCLNLGPKVRSFLFLDIPVTEMPCLGADTDGTEDDGCGNVDTMAARFLAGNPRSPVIRIDVAPGEAYVAPTELLIHDGAKPAASGCNRTFALRGHFRARVRDG
jgi:hypothetical protein